MMDADINDELSAVAEDDGAKSRFWQQHLDAWKISGLTQRAYSREHDLPIARFTYWKSKSHPNTPVAKGNKTDFVPVRLDTIQSSVRLRHPSGVIVECPAGTDVIWLRSLMGFNSAP